eukprot:scaffold1789_cov375-Prasinococcus_capsulatus_cf.AAC.3
MACPRKQQQQQRRRQVKGPVATATPHHKHRATPPAFAGRYLGRLGGGEREDVGDGGEQGRVAPDVRVDEARVHARRSLAPNVHTRMREGPLACPTPGRSEARSVRSRRTHGGHGVLGRSVVAVRARGALNVVVVLHGRQPDGGRGGHHDARIAAAHVVTSPCDGPRTGVSWRCAEGGQPFAVARSRGRPTSCVAPAGGGR